MAITYPIKASKGDTRVSGTIYYLEHCWVDIHIIDSTLDIIDRTEYFIFYHIFHLLAFLIFPSRNREHKFKVRLMKSQTSNQVKTDEKENFKKTQQTYPHLYLRHLRLQASPDYFGGNLWRSDTFGSGLGFVSRITSGPGFVNSVRVLSTQSDPIQSVRSRFC